MDLLKGIPYTVYLPLLNGTTISHQKLDFNLVSFFYKCRDGRLQIGDEIVNVNGRRLRGLSMDSARGILSNYSTSENFTKTMNTKR